MMMWMMMNMSGARDGLGAAAENLPQGEERAQAPGEGGGDN